LLSIASSNILKYLPSSHSFMSLDAYRLGRSEEELRVRGDIAFCPACGHTHELIRDVLRPSRRRLGRCLLPGCACENTVPAGFKPRRKHKKS
jgi:hypothetical protein